MMLSRPGSEIDNEIGSLIDLAFDVYAGAMRIEVWNRRL